MTQAQTFLNSFDKVFVINLPERTDRRKAIHGELDWLGGSNPDKIEIFPAVKPTEPGGFPSIGARGCFMSHLEILRQARDRGMRRILILEDDLMFNNSLKKYQQAVARHMASDAYDIAYLGHMVESRNGGAMQFEAYDKALMQSHFIAFRGDAIARLVTFFETMLKRPPGHPDGGPMHVDGAYSTFRAQNPDVLTQIAMPNLGFQRPSPSDIAGFRWFDKLAGLKELSALARRFRVLWMRNV
jgi:glycosyl transferase family 25